MPDGFDPFEALAPDDGVVTEELDDGPATSDPAPAEATHAEVPAEATLAEVPAEATLAEFSESSGAREENFLQRGLRAPQELPAEATRSAPGPEPFRAPLLASPASGRAIFGAGAQGGGPRCYPRLAALVASLPPARVEEPQAFFPRRPLEPRAPRRPSTARPEVEGMLRTMADGLLIGGDDRGANEVRVMLSDEFFRGTELRISMQDRRVRARFLPPDYETYRALDAEKDRLREHLSARGFVVSDVEISRP